MQKNNMITSEEMMELLNSLYNDIYYLLSCERMSMSLKEFFEKQLVTIAIQINQFKRRVNHEENQ